MKKLLLFAVLLFSSLAVFSSDFEGKSSIDSIPKSGFYKVLLSPEIIAGLNLSYSDIRLYDSKQKEIPYIFEEEQPLQKQTGFKEYEILENKHLQKPAITRVVIHNKTKSSLSNFVIIVRNSEVEKEITLKGSDDQQNWYIIKRNYPVSTTEIDGSTSEMKVLDFPKSNYEFFELTMSDKHKEQLQILKVGYYDSETHLGVYSEVPAPNIHQTDSLQVKKSYITLKFKDAYELSRLELVVNGPVYYRRWCTIGYYVKHKKQATFEPIGHFEISSDSNPLCNLDKVKVGDLLLVIDNEDNTPLQVVSVRGFFLNKYLDVYLKAGENYSLYFGNKSMPSPDYDLKYFADSVTKNFVVLKTGMVVKLSAAPVSQVSLIFNKTFLWIAIVLVIGLLSLVFGEVGKGDG